MLSRKNTAPWPTNSARFYLEMEYVCCQEAPRLGFFCRQVSLGSHFALWRGGSCCNIEISFKQSKTLWSVFNCFVVNGSPWPTNLAPWHVNIDHTRFKHESTRVRVCACVYARVRVRVCVHWRVWVRACMLVTCLSNKFSFLFLLMRRFLLLWRPYVKRHFLIYVVYLNTSNTSPSENNDIITTIIIITIMIIIVIIIIKLKSYEPLLLLLNGNAMSQGQGRAMSSKVT